MRFFSLSKQFLIVLIIVFSISANGQSIIGQWETFDDNTNNKKGLVEIYKENNTYSAKIIKTFIGPKDATCNYCKGSKKDQPIIGLVIIKNIKKNNNEFDGGTILDPESGTEYKCYLKLVKDNKLKVRGFVGFSVFGRTQYWRRKE